MATYNTDQTDLKNVASGGLVRESVMEKIWQIDKFPLVLTDMCSKATHGNQYNEFTTDELGDAATDNAHVDGIDLDQDDSSLGARVGNYTQTGVKEIRISTRANASNSVGRAGSLGYQVSQAQKRLRRDVEAQMCTGQASVQGDGNTIAGISAGLGAWIETNVVGGVGFVAGGFDPGTNIIDAPTYGTPRAISEAMIKDIMQAIFEEGGEGMYLMATPAVIRIISEYFFTDTAKAATMTNDNMEGTKKATAYASTNIIVTDFGTLNLVANRLQPITAANSSTAFILDANHLKQSFMTGYRTEALAKTGLSEKRMISCDYSLAVCNEKSQGAIFDVDHTAPMVA